MRKGIVLSNVYVQAIVIPAIHLWFRGSRHVSITHFPCAYFRLLPMVRQAEQPPTKQRLRIARTNHETPSNSHVVNIAASFCCSRRNIPFQIYIQ